MKKTFAFGAAATPGAWPVQEDGFYADPMRGVFAVADGFGGRGAGDLAAKAALLELKAGAQKTSAEIFASAQHAILSRNEKSSNKGGASLVLLSLRAGAAELTQCGACVALLVRSGQVHPLLVPQASPREPFQPLLPDHALGLGGAPVTESRRLNLYPGDLLALASSGVEWEKEDFRAEILARLLEHEPGSDLTLLTTLLVESGVAFHQGFNRTLLLIQTH